MKRIRGWEQALVRFTMSRMRTPQEWGSHDCCIFAADAIKTITGEDFAADFRGQYGSETEAFQLLAQLGYADLGALASSRLPEIIRDGQPAPHFAHRGDVVLVGREWNEYGEALGICDGISIIGPGVKRGIAAIPIKYAVRAWKVG